VGALGVKPVSQRTVQWRAESVSGLHFDLFSPHGPPDKGVSYFVLAHCRDSFVINTGF